MQEQEIRFGNLVFPRNRKLTTTEVRGWGFTFAALYGFPTPENLEQAIWIMEKCVGVTLTGPKPLEERNSERTVSS